MWNWLTTNASWLFDGILTSLVSFVLGGVAGWSAKSLVIKQSQKGGANSKNIQIGNINNGRQG